MALNDNVEKCKAVYEEACKTKDIARVSDNNINSFKQAAELYKQAAEIIFNAILTDKTIDHDTKIQSTALRHYYKFEECGCLYAFNYKNNNFPTAIQFATDGQKEINISIQTIETNFNSLGAEAKMFLTKMKHNWKSCAISIQIKKFEPIAKEAMIAKEYITAFDTYNKMLKIQKELYEYDEAAGLELVHIRIAKGNYIGMVANVNQAMAGILTTKISDKTFTFNLSNDLLKHFLNSLDLSFNAFEANPEWDKYRSGAETIRTNIQKLLTKNKEHWFEYLISNNNNSYLKTIMQQTDNETYKRQSAKLELEKDNTKNFLLKGLFWIVLLFCVLYVLMQIATSNISWYRFLAVMFGLPMVVTIIGAFILRTTDALKEENFLKLMTLALKINFQGLKVLAGKKDDNKGKN